jgi:dethiobiotin synthetase
MKGIFITGTDTNIGKTYIACKIAAELTAQKIHVVPRKPVESGCPLINGELIPDDALKLSRASQSKQTLETICPYRFEEAISPARAAQLNNQNITLQQLTQACTTQLNHNNFLLIEGAGGFYSPMANKTLNADLAKKVNLPILLVTEDRIGCINQVLLCLQAIQQHNLTVSAIVLNNITNTSNTGNKQELSQYTQHPIFEINANTSAKELVSCILK